MKTKFKGKPINDCPEEFKRLVRLAKEGPKKINDEYKDVTLDFAAYYLGARLGDYFKNDDPQIEELKTILYDREWGTDGEKDGDKNLYNWLRWYFPKMMKFISKGYTRFLRGFKMAMPGATNWWKQTAVVASTIVDSFVKNGVVPYLGTSSLVYRIDEINCYVRKVEYLKALQKQYPVICATPLGWDPAVEHYTRWAAKKYHKEGLPGYIDFMTKVLQSEDRKKVDETRILPKELRGRVDFNTART